MSLEAEPHYEPLGRPGRRRRSADCTVDSQGQTVEYERGYLRNEARIARGAFAQKSSEALRKKQAAAICATLMPDGGGVELLHVLDFGSIPKALDGSLAVELWWRQRGATALKPMSVTAEMALPSTADIDFIHAFHHLVERTDGSRGNRFVIPKEQHRQLLAILQHVANLRWSARQSDGKWTLHRLTMPQGDSEAAWSLALSGASNPAITLHSQSGDYPFEQWQLLSSSGWAVVANQLFFLRLGTAFPLLAPMIGAPLPALSGPGLKHFISELARDGGALLTEVPPHLVPPVETISPTGRLYVAAARYKHLGREQLQCALSFDYAGHIVADGAADSSEVVASGNRLLRRNAEAEEQCRQQLRSLGFRFVRRTTGDEDPGWKLEPARLEAAVFALINQNWEVKGAGKDYRRPVTKEASVSTFGIDWIEIKGGIDFGNGQTVPLPQLLSALQSGARSVLLDDGSRGILPRDWLEHFTVLTQIGESTAGRLLVRRQRAQLIDALLREQLTREDEKYRQLLADMERSEAASSPPSGDFTPPPEFKASLRPYQQIGAAWLASLARRSLSGLLADDMGLGKTVQVLAVLASRYRSAHPLPPSLIVAPSSLLFNWQQEASRFAAFLRVAQYYGVDRQCTPEWFARYDIVLTTYGTLRQDATRLCTLDFDYLILDESQQIKNAQSITAQSARVIRARHRIAMTGTPVENHLSELYSQLAFLNPGLFTAGLANALGKESTLLQCPATASRLRKLVRPFILRRRKEEVATELPAKTEQVIFCELSPEEREYYNQLRDYYRQELSGGEPGAVTMLSALLRLRQAACHPALINPELSKLPGAKLSLLSERLTSLVEGGHKALVFSQFTSLLRLAAEQCTGCGWKYCYLDGASSDRRESVEKFQQDPSIPLFFISLKAGGIGLNLTAADYVFLLDPWWNPAAESQAIDRAYRIGQQRNVFAYRLIARGTVEEKVLLMQQKKRAIAAAVVEEGHTAPDAPLSPPTAAELRELLTAGQ